MDLTDYFHFKGSLQVSQASGMPAEGARWTFR